MAEPTGRLKFAYQTIARMEEEIKELTKNQEKALNMLKNGSADGIDIVNDSELIVLLYQLISNHNSYISSNT